MPEGAQYPGDLARLLDECDLCMCKTTCEIVRSPSDPVGRRAGGGGQTGDLDGGILLCFSLLTCLSVIPAYTGGEMNVRY